MTENEKSIRINAIRWSAEQVDKLAVNLVGNIKSDGSRDSVVYEQGIGCERAAKMLRELAILIESSGE